MAGGINAGSGEHPQNSNARQPAQQLHLALPCNDGRDHHRRPGSQTSSDSDLSWMCSGVITKILKLRVLLLLLGPFHVEAVNAVVDTVSSF